ncbi:22292_t:CDS:2, partial [Gigaspora rosea]
PNYLAKTKCLKIIDQNGISQAFSVDSIDQNGYYNEQYFLAYTNSLKADITKNPWNLQEACILCVGLIIKMPSGSLCLLINAFPVADDEQSPIYSSSFLVDNTDDNGYFHVENYLVYNGLLYYFFAANNETGTDPCSVTFAHSPDNLKANITVDPWT